MRDLIYTRLDDIRVIKDDNNQEVGYTIFGFAAADYEGIYVYSDADVIVGVIVEPTDTPESFASFMKLAYASAVSMVIIDFSHLADTGFQFSDIEKNDTIKDSFVELENVYENRVVYVDKETIKKKDIYEMACKAGCDYDGDRLIVPEHDTLYYVDEFSDTVKAITSGIFHGPIPTIPPFRGNIEDACKIRQCLEERM